MEWESGGESSVLIGHYLDWVVSLFGLRFDQDQGRYWKSNLKIDNYRERDKDTSEREIDREKKSSIPIGHYLDGVVSLFGLRFDQDQDNDEVAWEIQKVGICLYFSTIKQGHNVHKTAIIPILK